MAVENPYHRLPEDNAPRPSMESIPGDDQRLLAEDSLYDDDTHSEPSNKGPNKFKLSYHPTCYLRLFVLCLFISSFAVFTASRHNTNIPSIVFLSFAILRNITVLYSHLVRRCFIRIHIEIVGRTSAVSNAKPKKWRLSWNKKRSVQLILDWTLIAVLIITTVVGFVQDSSHYWWSSPLTLPACILCWIALPVYFLATVDMGKPDRLSFFQSVSYDTAQEKTEIDGPLLPQTYRDVEVSGGLDEMTRKTGAALSPTN